MTWEGEVRSRLFSGSGGVGIDGGPRIYVVWGGAVGLTGEILPSCKFDVCQDGWPSPPVDDVRDAIYSWVGLGGGPHIYTVWGGAVGSTGKILPPSEFDVCQGGWPSPPVRDAIS